MASSHESKIESYAEPDHGILQSRQINLPIAYLVTSTCCKMFYESLWDADSTEAHMYYDLGGKKKKKKGNGHHAAPYLQLGNAASPVFPNRPHFQIQTPQTIFRACAFLGLAFWLPTFRCRSLGASPRAKPIIQQSLPVSRGEKKHRKSVANTSIAFPPPPGI